MTQTRFSRTRRAALATLGIAITALTPLSAHAQYVFTNIADTNTAAPAGGVFGGVSEASLSGSTVAFRGVYVSGDSGIPGIFTGSGGPVTTIVTKEAGLGNAPGGGDFDSVFAHRISGSTVGFFGYYNGFFNNSLFTSSSSGGALTTVVSSGPGTSDAPGGGAFDSVSGPYLSGSTVGFFGTYNDFTSNGIFTSSSSGGALITVVSTDAGSNAAPGGGTFFNFHNLDVSGSTVAFIGGYSGGAGTRGVFTSSGGALTTIATEGAGASAQVPGGGTFKFLGGKSEISLSGSTVAFLSNYIGGTGSTGIFTGSGGAITTIVTDADAVPGGGTWTDFQTLSISGSTVAFKGFYSGGTGSNGIFLSSGGSLTKLIGNGDTLFGSTVDSLSFESTGLDGTNVAFSYELADGRSGIALATLASSSSAPEPGTLALLSLGGALVMVQRRRKTILGGAR
jgi:PEP-CTERM motif